MERSQKHSQGYSFWKVSENISNRYESGSFLKALP